MKNSMDRGGVVLMLALGLAAGAQGIQDCGGRYARVGVPEPVVRERKQLHPQTFQYQTDTVTFTNGRYTNPTNHGEGGLPLLEGFSGKTGFIYDVSANARPIGPDNPYTGTTYGPGETQRAIQRYRQRKDFEDGTLDLFVLVRPWDPAPEAELARIYEIATFFGSTGGAANRNNPEARGMRRNPEARRNIRVFLLEGGPRPEGGETPVEYLQLASQMSNELGVDIAVSNRYVTIDGEGGVRIPGGSGNRGWVLLSPESRPTPSTP